MPKVMAHQIDLGSETLTTTKQEFIGNEIIKKKAISGGSEKSLDLFFRDFVAPGFHDLIKDYGRNFPVESVYVMCGSGDGIIKIFGGSDGSAALTPEIIVDTTRRETTPIFQISEHDNLRIECVESNNMEDLSLSIHGPTNNFHLEVITNAYGIDPMYFVNEGEEDTYYVFHFNSLNSYFLTKVVYDIATTINFSDDVFSKSFDWYPSTNIYVCHLNKDSKGNIRFGVPRGNVGGNGYRTFLTVSVDKDNFDYSHCYVQEHYFTDENLNVKSEMSTCYNYKDNTFFGIALSNYTRVDGIRFNYDEVSNSDESGNQYVADSMSDYLSFGLVDNSGRFYYSTKQVGSNYNRFYSRPDFLSGTYTLMNSTPEADVSIYMPEQAFLKCTCTTDNYVCFSALDNTDSYKSIMYFYKDGSFLYSYKPTNEQPFNQQIYVYENWFIYFGVSGGVYISIDHGASWHLIFTHTEPLFNLHFRNGHGYVQDKTTFYKIVWPKN